MVLFDGWRRQPDHGYSYWRRDQGSYYWAPLQSSQEPDEKKAYWRPDLQVNDPLWDVYVLVPVHMEKRDAHMDNVAPAAVYYVYYYDSDGTRTGVRRVINQRDHGGEWVRLGTFPTYNNWPLEVWLTNEVDAEGCSGTVCQGKIVMADAAVFIPSDCGP